MSRNEQSTQTLGQRTFCLSCWVGSIWGGLYVCHIHGFGLPSNWNIAR